MRRGLRTWLSESRKAGEQFHARTWQALACERVGSEGSGSEERATAPEQESLHAGRERGDVAILHNGIISLRGTSRIIMFHYVKIALNGACAVAGSPRVGEAESEAPAVGNGAGAERCATNTLVNHF